MNKNEEAYAYADHKTFFRMKNLKEIDDDDYANHYDEHTDDVYTSWQLNYYEIAKKVLKELKTKENENNSSFCIGTSFI